jgi:hypothetical protein
LNHQRLFYFMIICLLHCCRTRCIYSRHNKIRCKKLYQFIFNQRRLVKLVDCIFNEATGRGGMLFAEP